jgi:glycine hydroxymethyltransferase
VGITRDELLDSLDRQRELLAEAIVLTPTDSIPFVLADRKHTAFLHGLYVSDKERDRDAQRAAVIQFAGRGAAAKDITAIHALLAERLGASAGSLRLLAGLQAHAATFMSVAAIGQKVMLLPPEAGGHYSTHGILSRLGLQTLDIPVDRRRMCVDRPATLQVVEESTPDFVFIDRSEGLRYEDFSFLGELEVTTTIFDASQYLAPILTGRYENPLTWGFDLMLFTLHKSFPGPQKAGIVARQSGELWSRLLAGLSMLVSSSHAENTYLAGLALLREDWLEQYCERLLRSAAALEAALICRGVPVIQRARQGESDWPATHHLWIAAESQAAAFAHFEQLAAINILTNYRLLPYDLGYGLRLGTTASAIAGIDVEHADALAHLIEEAILGSAGEDARVKVRDLARDARTQAIVPASVWAGPSRS